MKKILLFMFIFVVCLPVADGAERTTNVASRTKNNIVITPQKNTRSKTSRTAVKTTVSARATKPVSVLTPKTKSVSTRTAVYSQQKSSARNSSTATQNVISRAAATTKTETKTGVAYEQCKTAFFTCMDQFCQLKNDNFRRCSCSDRIFGFQSVSENYQQISEKLTEFSENLDSVGMTYEQAIAMKTAAEGEDALTEDKSASKQLLQAIMNAIKGEESSVSGKYKELNSIDMSADMSNAFGMDDSGQIIASYNGSTLYKAVYPKCRNAVAEDCNSASLQRAVNAYLMAVEQDCNTVETALKNQQKTLKSSTKQSSAMLDLARVENRQKHNTDDISTCLVNVENAIQSEEVCGAKYHKCLDYGQFIDVSTGAPLTGVADFYKLGELLTFKNTENIKDQKLSTLSSNRTFVQFFENKTKKFAKDALDKCSEKADDVWQQYLDRALLDIYYSQQAKVDEIQQSCVDLITACYENQSTSISNAMSALTGDSGIGLKPGIIELTSNMCDNYIESCNNMFAGNVIKKYLKNKDNTDSITACRAVVEQCFDKFGGTGYENFYYPYSGLFSNGNAIDWFSLYQIEHREDGVVKTILSPCAQELSKTDGCNTDENPLLERVFGGFDKHVYYDNENNITDTVYTYTDNNNIIQNRLARTSGVASEIYYKIIDNLSTQCRGLNGYFVEQQYLKQYNYYNDKPCNLNTTDLDSPYYTSSDTNYDSSYVSYWYKFKYQEYMCPANYEAKVDVQSWGACSCWENGGFRSKDGLSKTCRPLIPVSTENSSLTNDPMCTETLLSGTGSTNTWCQNNTMSSFGQVCPKTTITKDANNNEFYCSDTENTPITAVQIYVPNHKKVSDRTNTSN